jgi:adenylosuccinate lyase
VLLALIKAGMAREEAYAIVHDRAMQSWQSGEDFRGLIRSESEVAARLERDELGSLFDYGYYVRHVDETFERAGLA